MNIQPMNIHDSSTKATLNKIITKAVDHHPGPGNDRDSVAGGVARLRPQNFTPPPKKGSPQIFLDQFFHIFQKNIFIHFLWPRPQNPEGCQVAKVNFTKCDHGDQLGDNKY
jgi:hypothetical protein